MVETTISLMNERKLSFKASGENSSNTKENKNQSRIIFLCFISEIPSFAEIAVFTSLQNFLNKSWWLWGLCTCVCIYMRVCVCACECMGLTSPFSSYSWSLTTKVNTLSCFHSFCSQKMERPLKKVPDGADIYCAGCLASLGAFQKPSYCLSWNNSPLIAVLMGL